MKHYHLITCPFCHNDGQRWRCNNCKKSFQLEYKYNACQAGIKDAIIQQTLNSSGVRDIRQEQPAPDMVCNRTEIRLYFGLVQWQRQ